MNYYDKFVIDNTKVRVLKYDRDPTFSTKKM